MPKRRESNRKMIKWLICLLWGHDINREIMRINQGWYLQSSPEPDWKFPEYWCNRCKKYKKR